MSPDERRGTDSEAESRPEPIPAAEVAKLISSILSQFGTIIPSIHFRRRGGERDFGTQDALEVLSSGTVNPQPIWNDKEGAWNYDVKGLDIEGESLTVRIAFTSTRTKIVLVTAF